MRFRAEIFFILLAILFFLFILQQLKQRRLEEKYTVFWFIIGILVILTSLFSDLWVSLANLLGVYYPPALLFVLAILALLVINLYYSIILTKLSKQNAILAQEIGLLEKEVHCLKEMSCGSSESEKTAE